MQIKDLFETCFDELENKTDKLLKQKQEETSNILSNFFDCTLEQLEDILSKKQTSNLKSKLKDEIIKELTINIKEIEKVSKEIINDMNKSTEDIISKGYKNYLFDINVSDVVIKECKTKISSINYLNKDFIKKYDNIFDLFLYNISTFYKLKNDVSSYNLINKTIIQNKKILFDNLKKIEDDLKEDIISSYEHCFNTFKIDVIGFKEGLNRKNSKLLLEYQEEKLKEKILLDIQSVLVSDSKKVEKVLLLCHVNVLKIEKGRNTKEKELELNILNNFLLSFNNTLFDKSQNTLLKMISVVSNTQEELEKNVKKFNEIIYKICDFEYNFDKPFLLYKNKMLNRTYFLTTTATEEVINIIEQAKIEVINIIKTSIIEVFENNINLLNKMSYKRLISEHKLQNFYGLLDKKALEKLLN